MSAITSSKCLTWNLQWIILRLVNPLSAGWWGRVCFFVCAPEMETIEFNVLMLNAMRLFIIIIRKTWRNSYSSFSIIAFVLMSVCGYTQDKSATNKTYEFRGNIIADGILGTSNVCIISYRAVIFSNDWHIYTYPVSPPSSKTGIERVEHSYDGTNEYWYVQFVKNTNKASKNSSQGAISKVTNPMPGGEGEAMPVWLALASNGYFDNEKPGVARDCWTWSDPSTVTNKNKIVIKRHALTPHLPVMIAFYNDGIWRGYTRQGQLIKRPYHEPFNEGFIDRVFYASNFVTIGKMTVPKQFRLEWWRLKSTDISKGTNALGPMEIVKWADCQIDEMRILDHNELGFVPATDGKTETDDTRYSSSYSPVQSISYLNTNKTWIPFESPKIMKLYNEEFLNKMRINYHSF